jgi:acyl-coenzyme A synthetase/AMP-(fatty) acid ligase
MIIDVLLGVTSVIPDISFPVPGRTDPHRVFDAVQNFKVTNMFASPVVLDILAEQGEDVKLTSLKRVITAGAPAPFRVQEKFRMELQDGGKLFGIYGATEALPIAMIDSEEVLQERERTAQGAGICLGKPISGMKVRVIRITDEPIPTWDDSLQMPANVIGEITVQGKAVTAAYVDARGSNQLGKINHTSGVIHRMGDVGYFDEHGRLWYCGRKSQRVETDHSIFFTEQIEGVFNAHAAVYRTALVGMDRQPVLWVELRNHGKNEEKVRQELIDLAKGHPQASRIKTFLFMKKFPTDVRHNSKIIREELAVLAARKMRS